MTCRHCKWLDVPLNKAGKRVAYKMQSYKCLFVPPLPPLPMSMSKSYNFRWPPHQSYVTPNFGEGCPCFEEREK